MARGTYAVFDVHVVALLLQRFELRDEVLEEDVCALVVFFQGQLRRG